ncbi:MAG TPA: UDP-N-acetylmuramate dehydrogenase [Candidatus Mcinerneyibacterium sp.]|nr:UDP-N-acetylmuramate dehydrogenase [Candidatus Mcinerneyibacterium sp.]
MNSLDIKKDKSLKDYNAYCVESKAKYYYNMKSIDKLKDVLNWASKKNLKIYILSGGTNILITKKQIDGLVVHINNKYISMNDNRIFAGAGVDTSLLVIHAYLNNLSGLEFLYGLPGKLGGAVYMNARAYNRSISDVIKEVKVIDYNGNIRVLKFEEMDFGYKKSIFQNENFIILEASFQLKNEKKKIILEKMNYNLNQRIKKGHFENLSCGSVFKNPYHVGIPAGKIIDDLNLKGTKIGNARIFNKHGNFIINEGEADGKTILKLINYVKKEVRKRKDVNLEEEVEIW